MKLTDLLRGGSRSEPVATPTGSLPIPGYEELDAKQVITHFRGLTQVELAGIEKHERAHGGRPAVLDKLRYMRSPEPLEGYDALEAHEVVRLLEDADMARVRAIRDYEGKFRARREVMNAAAKALPRAAPNAGEQHLRDEKALRTRTGIQERSERNA